MTPIRERAFWPDGRVKPHAFDAVFGFIREGTPPAELAKVSQSSMYARLWLWRWPHRDALALIRRIEGRQSRPPVECDGPTVGVRT